MSRKEKKEIKRKLAETRKLENLKKRENLVSKAELAEERGDPMNAAKYYAKAAEISHRLKDKKSIIKYSKLTETILRELSKREY